MQDTALYQYLLGLKSPWTVSRVHLNVTGQCVDVWAEHPEDAAWACPHCSKTLPLYDHAEERTWRHLDSCQFQTHLHALAIAILVGKVVFLSFVVAPVLAKSLEREPFGTVVRRLFPAY